MSKKRSLILAAAVVLIGLGGFAGFTLWRFFSVDTSVLVDEQVESVWLVGRERLPAEQFFADGGAFITRPAEPEEGENRNAFDIDQTVVLPLLTRLKEEAEMSWFVLPEKQRPNFAYAVIAERPAGFAGERSMNRVFREADAAFEGGILVLRGDRWVSFEIIPAGTPSISGQ